MFRADYARHEAIYAAHPTASGWNDRTVDREILAYADELLLAGVLAPPARLLELGCGMGNLTFPLAARGYEMVGVDIAATAIAAATRRARVAGLAVRFQVGDVTASQSFHQLAPFDGIVDGLCWHCIVERDRQTFLGIVRRLLKPGGCFLALSMCGDPRAARLSAHFDRPSRYIVSGNVAERYLGHPASLARELVDAGFDIAYQRVVPGDSATGDQDMFLAVARVPR